MSWWNRYFAPGDLRERHRIAAEAEAEAAAATARRALLPAAPTRIDAGARARRQNALLFGGLAFTMLSVFVTRRTMLRKRAAAYPSNFTQSNAAPPKVDASFEALHALNLATLNVFSFAMLASGVVMTWLDIADVEDMRRLLHQAVGEDAAEGEKRADSEIESWVAEVLSRKDAGGQHMREGVAEKLAEIERQKRAQAASK